MRKIISESSWNTEREDKLEKIISDLKDVMHSIDSKQYRYAVKSALKSTIRDIEDLIHTLKAD